jgi:hypothetical protein
MTVSIAWIHFDGLLRSNIGNNLANNIHNEALWTDVVRIKCSVIVTLHYIVNLSICLPINDPYEQTNKQTPSSEIYFTAC